MRFYSKKAPRRDTKTLMDQISTGKCDDLVVSDLKVAVSELKDPAEKELILTALKDIALKSGNTASVAASIKALMAFPPMEPGLEGSLEIRILELITSKVALSNRALQETIAEFLYLRVSEQVGHAAPFVDALIQFLEEPAGTVGTTAYNTLMIVAANRPEYFQQHAGRLIKMLGSINRATRVQTMRLIAVLAMNHPEYVADAEKTLIDISSFNPDGELKNSASEALQILSSKLRPEESTPIGDMKRRRREEPETTGGLAEIMRRKQDKDKKAPYESRIDKRLLSMATNFARKADRAYKTDGEGLEQEESETEAINKIMDDFSDIAQSIKAEAEPEINADANPLVKTESVEATHPEAQRLQQEIDLRRIMVEVQDDFSINAGSILDAIGMGHLAKKAMMDEVKPQPEEAPTCDRPKRPRLTRTEPAWQEQVPEKPLTKKKDEQEGDVNPKEFIAPSESIISLTEKEHAEEASALTTPFAAWPVAPAAAHGEEIATPEEAATADSPMPETEDLEPEVPDETVLQTTPQEAMMPEILVPTQPELPGPLKTPVALSGVRISAMKFKSIDQSKSRKTPTPPKVSIKPHIKPLNQKPIDGVKIAQVRLHPLASAPLAPRGLAPKAEALPGEIICHSCNGKMPEDSQRCAICGSDLKAPKVRCRKCGEINPKGAGKCNRCNSGMDE